MAKKDRTLESCEGSSSGAWCYSNVSKVMTQLIRARKFFWTIGFLHEAEKNYGEK